jgi:nitrate reductase NapE component
MYSKKLKHGVTERNSVVGSEAEYQLLFLEILFQLFPSVLSFELVLDWGFINKIIKQQCQIGVPKIKTTFCFP